MQVDKLPPTCCPFPYPLHSGNALLIGVGGSGKASLARFAAFVAGLEFVAVEARRGYGAAAFQEDVKRVYKVCVWGGVWVPRLHTLKVQVGVCQRPCNLTTQFARLTLQPTTTCTGCRP